MRTYIQPQTTTFQIVAENLIAVSIKDGQSSNQSDFTREQNRTNHGVGGGLWEDMK